jgi:hypothetical protein
MLSAELERLKSDQRQMMSLIRARPALEKLISRWKDVPRQERRSLFEACAHFIKITRLNTASKEISIYWRDGSQSAQIYVRKGNGYYWEPENLEKLRDMVENDTDQVEILRAFPDYSWRALQERYAYHYGDGHWRKSYAGAHPYPRNTRWEDTEEAQTESASQLEASSPSTCRRKIT